MRLVTRHFGDDFRTVGPNSPQKRAELMALFGLRVGDGSSVAGEGFDAPDYLPPPPTDDHIKRIGRDWNVLIHSLDFQNGQWYELVGEDWLKIAFFRVHDLMLDLGFGEPVKWVKVKDDNGEEKSQIVPDDERMSIIKQFIFRDRSATKRDHKSSDRGSGRRRDRSNDQTQRRVELEAQQELEL